MTAGNPTTVPHPPWTPEREGSREHVEWWSLCNGRGWRHCSEPNCEINEQNRKDGYRP